MVEKFVCHSKKVWQIAQEFGWQPGARYTNLRDVKTAEKLGFLDIDWKNYDFEKHLSAAIKTKPKYTVAQDILDIDQIDLIIQQAEILAHHCKDVIVVPKDMRLTSKMDELIPCKYRLGFSVPTKYGGTEIPTDSFGGRPVHLLGGRPDVQRKLAHKLNVVSLDTNRFTLDASFGDYFDGDKFRKHPSGGYEVCLRASLENINSMWS